MATGKITTSYQGGPYVDILTGQGRSPLEDFKISPHNAIQKIFDKSLKGFVFAFAGNSVSKLQVPNDEKKSLNLVQPYIVFQILVPPGQPFSLEFGISDANKNKRRIHLSSAFNKPDSTPLHARIPLTSVLRGVWLNLCFDLASLVNYNFKGQAYRSLDLVIIHPYCTIRRIFTLRSPPYDTSDDQYIVSDASTEPIPHTHEIPPDVESVTQVFTMEKLLESVQLQQQQNLQQQSPPQPEASKVPLAFGRRVNSAKNPSTPGTPQTSRSPPQPHPPLFQHYPSSPQTPTTRLAAKAKAAAGKPTVVSAVSRPISGSNLPKMAVATKGKFAKPESMMAPKGKEISPPEIHRNITPIPPSLQRRDTFSEVPPRSASPEIPRHDEEDEDYVDENSYGSDEEYTSQDFGGVTLQPFSNKDYQSSRYQASESTSAGSDRAISAAMYGLNLNNNPPISYTSHVNTKPIVKDTGAWGNSVHLPTITQNRRYSAELSEDPNMARFASTRKAGSDGEVTPHSTRRPATHSGRPALGVVPEFGAEDVARKPVLSSSADRPDSTRKSTVRTSRSADTQLASVRPPSSSKRVSSASPRISRTAIPDNAQRVGTPGTRKPGTQETGGRVSSATKIQESKKSSMEDLMKTAQENGLQKSSSGHFQYTEDGARVISNSRGSARAAQPLSARPDLQGSRHHSIENAYSRLVVDSDLPVHKKSMVTDEEDDVNTGEGEGRDESGILEEESDTRNSIDMDQDEGGERERGDEDGDEGAGEDEEIDEEIEESGMYNYDDRESDGEVVEDFHVYSTNEAEEGEHDSDDEGHIIYDSTKNAYYDTKNKKPVNLH